MATPIKMPTLGLTMESGKITRWLKREGESVAKDEPLFSVETDKAENDVDAPVGGVLLKIVVQEGEEAPVQRVIAYIGQPGEQVTEDGGVAAPAAPQPASAAPAAATAAAAPSNGSRELRASPLARRIARELGVDLAQVRGSGPEGRIQEGDVRAFAERQAAPAAAQPAPAPVTAAAAPVGGTQPLGRVRRVTAERMAQSARSVARVTLFAEADFEEAVRFRAHLRADLEQRHGARLTYDAMLVRACALALREHPVVNSQWADGALRPMQAVNIGVAVAVDEGLLVAVVRDADRKNLVEISRDIADLADKARAGKLTPAEMQGSTFTITNLGGHGVDAFTPIVNLPDAAILGVGRIAQRAAVVDGTIQPRHTCWLSLSFDHRVVDGAPAGDFLARVAAILAKPYLLVGM